MKELSINEQNKINGGHSTGIGFVDRFIDWFEGEACPNYPH